MIGLTLPVMPAARVPDNGVDVYSYRAHLESRLAQMRMLDDSVGGGAGGEGARAEADRELDDGRSVLEYAAEAARATVAFGLSSDFPTRRLEDSAGDRQHEHWDSFFAAQQPEGLPKYDHLAYTERFNEAVRATLGEHVLQTVVTPTQLTALVVRGVRRALALQLGLPDSPARSRRPRRTRKRRAKKVA